MKCVITRFAGLGRVLLHSALTGTSGNFCRLIGLELSDSRLEQAEYTLERLRDAYVDDPAVTERLNRVEFHREDVTSSALSLEATHVFMCSTAFGAVACRKIVEQLYQSEHFQVSSGVQAAQHHTTALRLCLYVQTGGAHSKQSVWHHSKGWYSFQHALRCLSIPTQDISLCLPLHLHRS